MRIRELLELSGNPSDFQPEEQPQQQQQPEAPQGGLQGAPGQSFDNNLEDIAQGSADQDAQPDMPGGSGDEQPELDNSQQQPIDDALLAQIKSMPFATKYNFNPKMKLTPMKIAAMNIEDLSNLRQTVRFKMQNVMMQNQVGLDDDSTVEYCTDLLRFVNTVISFKRKNTAAQLAQFNPGQSYQTMKRQRGQ